MKQMLLHVVFIISFTIWLLFAHFIGQWFGYLLLAMLMIGCNFFYRKKRSFWDNSSLPAKRVSNLIALFIALDLLSALAGIGFSFISFSAWKSLGGAMVLFITVVWIITIKGYAKLKNSVTGTSLIVIQGGVYAVCVAVAVTTALTYQRLGMGLNPPIRVIVVTVSLAVCMVSYLIYQTSYNKEMRSAICVTCLALSFALTLTLNWKLCTSTYTLHTYQATGKPYKKAITCILDNGQSFSYKYCPVASGEVGYVYKTYGWFQIQYLLRPNDTLVK